MPWREGECMNWQCNKDGVVVCGRCEQSYCADHLLHFCCSGHDEDELTCLCDEQVASA